MPFVDLYTQCNGWKGLEPFCLKTATVYTLSFNGILHCMYTTVVDTAHKRASGFTCFSLLRTMYPAWSTNILYHLLVLSSMRGYRHPLNFFLKYPCSLKLYAVYYFHVIVHTCATPWTTLIMANNNELWVTNLCSSWEVREALLSSANSISMCTLPQRNPISFCTKLNYFCALPILWLCKEYLMSFLIFFSPYGQYNW